MGFTDLSRLFETVLPLLRAMLLTRQGISLRYVTSLSQSDECSKLILHVAMQLGLYLHRRKVGVRRLVSEDSDYFGSWLAMIHGLGDFDDFDQPTCSEVRIRLDHP